MAFKYQGSRAAKFAKGEVHSIHSRGTDQVIQATITRVACYVAGDYTTRHVWFDSVNESGRKGQGRLPEKEFMELKV